ncbi:multidrug resistance-associated protein 1 [Caerostris extrusa]|uniref:Multidrug resistance-associated protein 1 n=1 Tax=Caerostris extrusa TaxID=172846 RepID=A0AAV4MUI1_CAEEX|nr:multidrug resistance-associated protein 1 [Caerostris extrusa]
MSQKGVNLSGGQKQRVSLARAVYQDADIYLLDDPLSAVDSHVGSHIFQHVIGPEGALQNKTRILATHDFSVLQEVDKIYLMSEGQILESGSYQELLDEKGEFARLIDEYIKKKTEEEINEEDDETGPLENEMLDSKRLSTGDLKAQMQKLGSRLSRTLSRNASVEEKETKKVRFIENERMEIGRVRAGIFWIYFRYATVHLAFMFILGFAAFKCFEIGSNVWLSKWSSDEPLPDGTQDVPLRNLRLGIYGLIGLGQGLTTLIATIILAIASTRASIRFHKSMLWSVLRSPMEFFDTTPLGRILNRFGKDINSVDVSIPSRLQSVTIVIVGVIGSFCFYMACSRQIRRLQSVTLSPVLSFFSETVQGVSTLRAFSAQYTFVDRQDKNLDTNCQVFYSSSLLNRWLGVRLQFLGNTVVFITALMSAAERRSFSAAIVGLTLSYALSVTENLATFVRLFTQLENQMVSVERIHEYSDLTPENVTKNSSVRFLSSAACCLVVLHQTTHFVVLHQNCSLCGLAPKLLTLLSCTKTAPLCCLAPKTAHFVVLHQNWSLCGVAPKLVTLWCCTKTGHSVVLHQNCSLCDLAPRTAHFCGLAPKLITLWSCTKTAHFCDLAQNWSLFFVFCGLAPKLLICGLAPKTCGLAPKLLTAHFVVLHRNFLTLLAPKNFVVLHQKLLTLLSCTETSHFAVLHQNCSLCGLAPKPTHFAVLHQNCSLCGLAPKLPHFVVLHQNCSLCGLAPKLAAYFLFYGHRMCPTFPGRLAQQWRCDIPGLQDALQDRNGPCAAWDQCRYCSRTEGMDNHVLASNAYSLRKFLSECQ